MIGLRKVVKLTVEEIPENRIIFNRGKSRHHHGRIVLLNKCKDEELSYIYSWRNKYYLGKDLLFKGKNHDNVFNLPLMERVKGKKMLGDDYLKSLSKDIVKSDEDCESHLFEGEDFFYYHNDEGSRINFPSGDVNKVKKLVFKKNK